jgi:uncharacterized membrane protein YedE/YeeE
MVLSYKTGGVLLGLVFFAAVLLVKPIGVSTQFVVLNGMMWDAAKPEIVVKSSTAKSGYASPNDYLNKSGGQYAKAVASPLNYGFIFVAAMAIGAAISAILRGGVSDTQREMPEIWRANFGSETWKRYLATFASGFVVLYGARLAGGCTSGHMISGMMQTSLSGYIFSVGVFLAGIPLALILFKKGTMR